MHLFRYRDPAYTHWEVVWGGAYFCTFIQVQWNPSLKDTPEIRTPLYKGHLVVSQICFLNVNEDTSPYRTLYPVPKVSTIEGFLCINYTYMYR